MDISNNFFRILKNSGWLLIDYAARFIGGYFVSIWLAREIGAENFGIYSYALSIVAILMSFAVFGIQGVGIKTIVENKADEKSILGTLFGIRLSAGSLSYITLIVILFFINTDHDKFLLAAIIGLKLIVSSFNVIDYYFDALVQSKYKVRARVTAYIIRTLLIILFIIAKVSLYWLAVIVFFEEIVGSLLVIYFFFKRGNSKIRQWKFETHIAKSMVKQSWPLIFSNIGAMLYLKIDQLMVVDMLGETAGGHYAAAVKITELFYFIPAIIISSAYPIIIESKKKSKKEYLEKLKLTNMILFTLAIIFSFFVATFSDQIIYFTFGSEYLASVKVVTYHIWTLVFVYVGQVLSRWLIIEKLTIFSLIRHGSGVIVNLVLNFLLIPLYGMVGAAVASLISLFTAVILFLFFNQKTIIFLKILVASISPVNFANGFRILFTKLRNK